VIFQSVTKITKRMSAATAGPVLIRVEISMFADVMLDGKTVEVEFVSLVFHLLDVSKNILNLGLVVIHLTLTARAVLHKSQTHVSAQKDGQEFCAILLNA